MSEKTIEAFQLIGISLPAKTTNKNGQSGIDCGGLWKKFEAGKYFDKIPNKIDNEIYAVYHQYDGDHMEPFSYFIGCKVEKGGQNP